MVGCPLGLEFMQKMKKITIWNSGNQAFSFYSHELMSSR
jgi:hypothetical protein